MRGVNENGDEIHVSRAPQRGRIVAALGKDRVRRIRFGLVHTLRETGLTFDQIGEVFNLSREAMRRDLLDSMPENWRGGNGPN